MILAVILFGYLLGSIPFGLLYGKLAGVDVRRKGSGNIGATNVTRLLGRKLGILTLASDMAKGIIPMAIASQFFAQEPNVELFITLAGTAAFLGHCFPVYLGFKGGKGVATALGIYLFLSPVSTLWAILVFISTVLIRGYVSLGSLLASAAMPLILLWSDRSGIQIGSAVVIGLVIWIKHHTNIKRLLNGTEDGWKEKNR
ncbi:MAG: glycerol-3-phosphate 1-O-acyltransferase PlsY [Proteobacteria bacterium]|nr:glycerol-3-phosphate 1-O-acyltransferase PlsY [Pseudomonadota bacterium]MBU1687911.1 glycerol-3-phosphate 1-O-acyltransferase PlsY [Pseudomonadota bacterium]